MSKMRLFLRTWGPSLLMMGAIFCFSSIPSNEMPYFGLADFLVKKGGHATGYALLVLANMRAFGWDRKRWWLAWLLAVLYSATDEFHQSFVPGRHPAITDVGIDALGAAVGLLGLLLWGWWQNRKQKTKTLDVRF
jgi:VanZ family protein